MSGWVCVIVLVVGCRRRRLRGSLLLHADNRGKVVIAFLASFFLLRSSGIKVAFISPSLLHLLLGSISSRNLAFSPQGTLARWRRESLQIFPYSRVLGYDFSTAILFCGRRQSFEVDILIISEVLDTAPCQSEEEALKSKSR